MQISGFLFICASFLGFWHFLGFWLCLTLNDLIKAGREVPYAEEVCKAPVSRNSSDLFKV